MSEFSFSNDQAIHVSEGVLSRVLDEDTVLLDLDAGMYFGLNEVAGVAWSIIKEGTTVGALRARLLEEFAVEPEQLDTDLEELLVQLRDRRLIRLDA